MMDALPIDISLFAKIPASNHRGRISGSVYSVLTGLQLRWDESTCEGAHARFSLSRAVTHVLMFPNT